MPPDITTLLDTLLSRIHSILGDNLVGLYLYGSLVTGDFDYNISDIDLLAVTTSDINDTQFSHLARMHNDIAARNQQWQDRIEVAYISIAALKTYNSHPSPIAVISPGEPFHIKEAGKDWAINWYVIRQKGVALYGSPPTTLIDPISQQQFHQIVIDQTRDWANWLGHIKSRPYQAYVILTMCRALYAFQNGEQVSKKQAALWAQRELPQWSSLIANALSWREAYREQNVDHKATLSQTIEFVLFVIGRVTGSSALTGQSKDTNYD